MARKDKNKLLTRDEIKHAQLINHIGNIVVNYCSGCVKVNKSFECTSYLHPIDRCRIGCSFSPVAALNLLEMQQQRVAKQRSGQQKQKKKK